MAGGRGIRIGGEELLQRQPSLEDIGIGFRNLETHLRHLAVNESIVMLLPVVVGFCSFSTSLLPLL